ncbi:pyridoxamine 5'-phosphate oxidase family protein [Viscerimonas tarda]
MITITTEERTLIDEIIKKNKLCHVAMVDVDGLPYVIPMNFGFEDNIIYLHSAQEGHSISSLEANPTVCIVFCPEPELAYQDEDVACSYRMKGSSVMCRGKVCFEEDYEAKVKALDCIMKQYSVKKFTYSAPAVKNVKIWRIEVLEITTKIFGVPYPKSGNIKHRG